MKVKDLIKNAIVLHSGGKAGAETSLPRLLREIQLRNLSSLGAYLLAQIDNELDPLVGAIRHAGAQEAEGRSQLLRSITGMSSFNKVLNERYGIPNSILLNVDDPGLTDVIASLPHGILKYQPVRRPSMPHLNEMFSSERTLVSFIDGVYGYLKDRHEFNKAVSETLVERNSGHRFGVFSKMTFLRSEKLTTFPHATLIRPRDGMSVSLLRFSPDEASGSASTWHGKELLKTYLFSHELGHCVMADETHQLHHDKFMETGDEILHEWMDEVYADIYSALFVARMNKNWDFLSLCILPERVVEEPDHNTFHCLRKLPSMVSIDELSVHDDRSLPRLAHHVMTEILQTESSPQTLAVQNCAARLYRWSQENPEAGVLGFEEGLDTLGGEARDAQFRISVIHAYGHRIQADIDSLGTKMQLGVGDELIKTGLLGIAASSRMAGYAEEADFITSLSSLKGEGLFDEYRKLMSKSALAAGARYEETMISIQNFWSDWKTQEMGFERKQKSPPGEERALI